VEEVEPFSREVFDPIDSPVPWDIRPEPPAAVFTEMIRKGGLLHVEDSHFHTDLRGGLKMWLQISKKPLDEIRA
jgi:hypothetical protein